MDAVRVLHAVIHSYIQTSFWQTLNHSEIDPTSSSVPAVQVFSARVLTLSMRQNDLQVTAELHPQTF